MYYESSSIREHLPKLNETTSNPKKTIKIVWRTKEELKETFKENIKDPEEIAKRVCSILKSYIKKLANKWNYKNSWTKLFTQNKHLVDWEQYSKSIFKKAGIPYEYYNILIWITKSYINKYEVKDKINYNKLENTIIKIIKNVEN